MNNKTHKNFWNSLVSALSIYVDVYDVYNTLAPSSFPDVSHSEL